MAFELFYMWECAREDLIKNHNFYITEARNRLLAQFNDIELEADAWGQKKLKEYAGLYNPDSDNACELQEAAYDELCSHYQLLDEMRNRTRLSVVAGMFHEWDKQLRSWVADEVRRWHSGSEMTKAIWKVDCLSLFDFFECLGWKVSTQGFYISLNRCRLTVNVYKHGEGHSFEEMKTNHNDLLYKLEHESPEWIDHTRLKIEDCHLREFSEAIIDFWKNIPERIIALESSTAPDWFEKAYNKDKKTMS